MSKQKKEVTKAKTSSKKHTTTSTLAIIVFLLLIIIGSYVGISSMDQQAISETGTFSLFGNTFDIKHTSLLLASIIIGLLDGFNPCAMWVLIYLISLVSTLNDKKKLYYIVGTFVTTEAIMYFLVLAGWLNLFIFIGYSKWILLGVGFFALGMGLATIIDYIKKKGKVECEVGDLESKKKTMNKIKEIVHSPITIASVFATILLAVIVNSIEFICSAGLPAVFTQMLAIADISTFMKYFYIFVYDLFFMIDDFIVFGLAIYAMNSPLLDKYSSYSKIIGGVVMLIIGIVLVFFPEFLM
jgi:hypothetical protein